MLTTKTPAARLSRNWHAPRADYVRYCWPFTDSTDGVKNRFSSASLSNLAATNANTGTATVTSASNPFRADDPGGYLILTSAGDWLPAAYRILSYVSAGEITVAGPIASVASPSSGAGWVHACNDSRAGNWHGTLAGSGGNWIAGSGLDTTETRYIQGPSNPNGAGGADWKFYRGTLLFLFTCLNDDYLFFDGVDYNQLILSATPVSGDTAPTTAGKPDLAVSRSGARFRVGTGSGTLTMTAALTLAGDPATGDVVAVMLRWQNGHYELGISKNFGTPVWATADLAQTYLVVTSAAVPRFWQYFFGCDVLAHQVTHLDYYLPRHEIDRWLADPYTYDRPILPGGVTPFEAGPGAWMPKAQSEKKISFVLCGHESSEWALGTPAEQVRMRYGSDPYLVSSSTGSAHEFATADQLRRIEMEVTLGSGNDLYAQCEWSPDGGTTWITAPLARYHARFNAERVGLVNDTHAFGLYGSEAFFSWGKKRSTTVNAANEGTRRMGLFLRDAEQYAETYGLLGFVEGGDTIGQFMWNGSEVYLAHLTSIAPGIGMTLGNWEKSFVRRWLLPSTEGTPNRDVVLRRLARVRNPRPGEGLAEEDQGPPDEIADEATGVHYPTVDWLPPYHSPSDFATNQLIVDAGGATWADKLGPLAGPLENFWARRLTLGSRTLDIIAWDITSYSGTDVHDSLVMSDPNAFQWGNYQWDTLIAASAASTADFLIWCMHNGPGGRQEHSADNGGYVNYGGAQGAAARGFYARSTMVNPETGELQKTIDTACEHRVNGILQCHNHKYGRCKGGRNNSLNLITLTTPSFSARFAVPEYGSAHLGGSDGAGVQVARDFWGWSILKVVNGLLVKETRVTAPDCSELWNIRSFSAGKHYTQKWAGQLKTVSGGAITLDEAPRSILGVCAAADGDFAADNASTPVYTGGAANVYDETDQSYYVAGGDEASLAPWDEPHLGTSVDVSAGGFADDDEVYVYAAPMVFEEAVLNRASPAATGGGSRMSLGL